MLVFRKEYNCFLLLFSLLFYSCKENPKSSNFPISEKNEVSNADLEAVNRQLLRKEIDQIEQLIKRNQWNMEVSPSGLRYQKYKTTQGAEVSYGDKVSLSVSLHLLNGIEIFSSEKEGLVNFVIGKAQAPRGLEEAVINMRKGEKMRLILPSHLGYGLYGDGSSVPPKAVLIYDVELIGIYIPKNKNKN